MRPPTRPSAAAPRILQPTRRGRVSGRPWPAAAFAALVLPAAACDLKAEFVAPDGSTHNGANPLTLELRLSNVGSTGDCPANRVRLVRQASDPAQALIGGVGPVALRALAPKQSVTLRFVENSPPKAGTHVYRPAYENKFLDPNERNHHPSKSVSFHAAYTLGG